MLGYIEVYVIPPWLIVAVIAVVITAPLGAFLIWKRNRKS